MGARRPGWGPLSPLVLVTLGLLASNVAGIVQARRRARRLRIAHDVDGHYALRPQPDRPALRLATIGDSVMEGDGIADRALTLPSQIAAQLAGAAGRAVELTQLGVSGATAPDVVAEQVPRLPDLAPDVVAISTGVNDGLRRRPLNRIRRDHAQLAAAVRSAAPHAAVVLVGAPDLRHAPALPRPSHQVVGWLTGRVGRRQAAWLADHDIAVIEMGTPTSDFGPDGFHPGPTATPTIATRVVEAALALRPSLTGA